MRFSYVMLPDYPLDDCIEYIKTADELGFHACYSVDETWHKDLWVLFAAAARETKNIRFGPNVTHVFLREPTLICQQMATLDELTGGRTEIVVSTGNFGLLAQYEIDWEGRTGVQRSYVTWARGIGLRSGQVDTGEGEGALQYKAAPVVLWDFKLNSSLVSEARRLIDRSCIEEGLRESVLKRLVV
jgi:hypothetical protein